MEFRWPRKCKFCWFAFGRIKITFPALNSPQAEHVRQWIISFAKVARSLARERENAGQTKNNWMRALNLFNCCLRVRTHAEWQSYRARVGPDRKHIYLDCRQPIFQSQNRFHANSLFLSTLSLSLPTPKLQPEIRKEKWLALFKGCCFDTAGALRLSPNPLERTLRIGNCQVERIIHFQRTTCFYLNHTLWCTILSRVNLQA